MKRLIQGKLPYQLAGNRQMMVAPRTFRVKLYLTLNLFNDKDARRLHPEEATTRRPKKSLL